jgi:hypothetical protein
LQRKYNEVCLESAYNDIAKRFERVPLMTREGMEVQINDALTFARKPAAGIKVEDIVDDRLVVELEKKASSSGFTNRKIRYSQGRVVARAPRENALAVRITPFIPVTMRHALPHGRIVPSLSSGFRSAIPKEIKW